MYIGEAATGGNGIPLIANGISGVICEAYTLADNVFNGCTADAAARPPKAPREEDDEEDEDEGGDRFIGLTHLSQKFDTIRSALSPQSEVMQELHQSIASTSDVTYAIHVFRAYLDILNTNMGIDTNVDVGMHECVFCKACCTDESDGVVGDGRTVMSRASDALEESSAKAMADVRESVKKSISGDELKDSRKSIKTVIKDMDEAREKMAKSISENLIDNEYYINTFMDAINAIIIAGICLMLIPTLFVGLIVGYHSYMRLSPAAPAAAGGAGVVVDDGDETQSLLNNTNPAGAVTIPILARSKFISSGWCLTFLISFLIFIFAGVFGVVNFADKQLCDILSDTEALIDGIQNRFPEEGEEGEEEEESMLSKVASTCLGDDSSFMLSKVLGSGIDITEEEEEEEEEDEEGVDDNVAVMTTTQRRAQRRKQKAEKKREEEEKKAKGFDKLLLFRNRIRRKFRKLENKEDDKFSNNPQINELIDGLERYGDLFMVSALGRDTVTAAVPGAITQSLRAYMSANIGADPNRFTTAMEQGATQVMKMAFMSVPDCQDKTDLELVGDIGESIKYSITSAGERDPGDRMTFRGTNSFIIEANVAQFDIGNNGNTCPVLAASLRTGDPVFEPFRDLLADKMNVLNKEDFVCDEINIVGRNDDEPRIQISSNRRCTWEQWHEYLREMVLHLRQAAREVDDAQDQVGDKIVVDLQESVENAILVHIDDLEANLNCRFVRDRYIGLQHSICKNLRPGISSVTTAFMAFGFICWMTIIMEMLIWRKRVREMDVTNN